MFLSATNYADATPAVTLSDEPVVAVVSAAKLHVLQLEPIKARLGARWERLSDLVHKLFETALKQAQTPRDHFLLVGELSYVVTFHDLTLEEAGVACAAVARTVCKRLFGDGIDEIAVRSLVGTVPKEALLSPVVGQAIAALLEKSGTETVINRSRTVQSSAQPDDAILRAHQIIRPLGFSLAFHPIWDLQAQKSSALFLGIHTGGANRSLVTARHVFAKGGEQVIAEAEIALLNAAGQQAQRVREAQRICAIGVGVSYETLTGFHSRIRYIGALKALPALETSPILLKIEQVPDGTPLGRLAELVAMFKLPNLRILLEFASPATLPALDVRLDAGGIGAVLPDHCGHEAAGAIAQKLTRRVGQQRKAFGFLAGLASPASVTAAREHQIRFGMGPALDGTHNYTGLENVPEFPLMPRP